MRTALTLTLLAFLLACSHKASQPEQIAALDEAYKSGVFGKEEYDARRAALANQPPTAAAPAPVTSAPPVAIPPPSAAPVTPEPTPAPISTPPVVTSAPAPAPVAPTPPPSQPPPQPAVSTQVQPAPTQPAPKAAKIPAPAPAETAQAEPEPAPTRECEDAEYKSHKNGRQSRFFPVPVARAKKAALFALSTLDFEVHKDESTEIEASKRRHIGAVIGAGGEREILQFEAAKQNGVSGTRVTGETKKSIVGRLAQKSWTGAVLAQLACNLL